MQRRTIELSVLTVLILVSLSILFMGKSMVDGGMESGMSPLFLPRIIAALIIIFSLMGIVEARKKKDSENLGASLTSMVKNAGIFFVYLFVLPYAGFIPATTVMMFVVMFQMGGRNLPIMTFVSIAGSVIIYYASYHMLKVLLPPGCLFQ